MMHRIASPGRSAKPRLAAGLGALCQGLFKHGHQNNGQFAQQHQIVLLDYTHEEIPL